MTLGIEIREAASGEDYALAAQLFGEYAGNLGFALDFQDFDEELEKFPGHYSSPRGSVLLGFVDGELAGCVAMRPLDESTCEMKRLFVRSGHRGEKLGRALAQTLIWRASQSGYEAMRLDTLASMIAANRLYASLGFKKIAPYRHNPLPDALFFELPLGEAKG